MPLPIPPLRVLITRHQMVNSYLGCSDLADEWSFVFRRHDLATWIKKSRKKGFARYLFYSGAVMYARDNHPVSKRLAAAFRRAVKDGRFKGREFTRPSRLLRLPKEESEPLVDLLRRTLRRQLSPISVPKPAVLIPRIRD